jgi:hypothetical protein
MLLGMALIGEGFWVAGTQGRAALGFLAPVGYVLFCVGLIRWLVPGFFTF